MSGKQFILDMLPRTASKADNFADRYRLVQNFGDESYLAFIGLNDINQEKTLVWIVGNPASKTDLTLLCEGFWRTGSPLYQPADGDYGATALKFNIADSGYNEITE